MGPLVAARPNHTSSMASKHTARTWTFVSLGYGYRTTQGNSEVNVSFTEPHPNPKTTTLVLTVGEAADMIRKWAENQHVREELEAGGVLVHTSK